MLSLHRSRVRAHGYSGGALALGVTACLGAGLVMTPLPAADLAAGRQADVAYARSEYVLKSLALSPEARSRALAYLEQLGSRVATMSEAEFLLAMARVPAFADNAHDVFHSGHDAWWPETRLPFRLVWFPDGLLVARAAPERQELLGARITRIEGLTPERLLDQLHAVCGGTDAYRRWNALWVLSNGQFMHALGLAKSAQRLQLRGAAEKRAAQDPIRVDYVPEASVPADHAPDPPAVRRVEQGGDRKRLDGRRRRRFGAALPATGRPAVPQDPPAGTRRRLSAAAQQYGRGRSSSSSRFWRKRCATLRAAPARNLVFDLRFNVGGDISQSRDFLREITKLVPGRIYVLISRYTFSAGIVSVAALKHDAASRAVLVGEEVGDRLRFWSEGERACLPNSHFCLRQTSGLWDLVHGCKSEPACYGDQFDATAGSLRPQLERAAECRGVAGRSGPGHGVGHEGSARPLSACALGTLGRRNPGAP